MTAYDTFFSRSAYAMRESPIRLMGAVAAQRRDIISFAPGYPGAETFAWETYRTIADRVFASRDKALLQYGPTRGFPPLVEALTSLHTAREIDTFSNELLVTTGSQQGLDLVARTLVDPGDAVLVELPSYTGAIAAFRNAQAAMIGVAQEHDGIDLGDLDRALHKARAAGRRAKFLYVVPNFQNPTGLLLTAAKRRALLEWSAREDVLIIEDDPYGALYFDEVAPGDTRPIKADDIDGRVIYLSSLSKTMAPAFRAAWVLGPPPLVGKMQIAKQAVDLCTSNLDQRIVYEAIREGVLERSEPRLREYYQEKRTLMEEALRAELAGLATWPVPKGGFFLWLTLAVPLDAAAVLDTAVAHGVVFVAGHAFYVDGGGRRAMRLAFSMPDREEIREGIRRLGAAIREAWRPPAHEAPSER